jgi:hypothetical protein
LCKYGEKILLYKDACTAVEGIAPVSHSWAKKHILGFSDEEIKLDIQQQRIEKAVATELTNTPTVIVKTGIFDNIDKPMFIFDVDFICILLLIVSLLEVIFIRRYQTHIHMNQRFIRVHTT